MIYNRQINRAETTGYGLKVSGDGNYRPQTIGSSLNWIQKVL